MARLLLGPLLRYVSETEATIWVETDEPCEVAVLGHRERTFTVEEHHFALVCVEGLEPGQESPYEVELDGERRWPREEDDFPSSAIRTIGGPAPLRIAFGSCRVSLPHAEPYVHSKDRHEDGFEFDALHVLAGEMRRAERNHWPRVLLLLGDQVYVDEGAPETRRRIRERRGTGTPPGDEVTDFEEYTWLYHESWSEPAIRWLFSTVSTSMVWDDHDMSDDWNISRSWLEEMREKPWWHHRAVAGIMSYWVYQHIGNLSPSELADNDLYQSIRGDDHATAKLREFAVSIDVESHGSRWSFCRDFGATRAIFMDSRAGRVLSDQRRSITDDEEWRWIVERATGDFDHLLIATTVPFLLSPGLHHLEAWSERVCDGAWGKPAAWAGEKLRRAVDFDHWASFSFSFERLRELIEEVGSGARGAPPASIVVLSGDVHHAYLAEVGFREGAAVSSSVYQAVCSPYRNPLSERERRVIRAGFGRAFTAAAKALARLSGAPDPQIRWRLAEGPYFDNQVATIEVDGRAATLKLDKTVAGEESERNLERVFERPLT